MVQKLEYSFTFQCVLRMKQKYISDTNECRWCNAEKKKKRAACYKTCIEGIGKKVTERDREEVHSLVSEHLTSDCIPLLIFCICSEEEM